MFQKLCLFPGPFWRIYSFLAMTFVMLSIPIWASVILLRQLFPLSVESESWYLQIWNSSVLKILRITLHVKGQENFDSSQASILVSNHQSFYDIPATFCTLKTANIRMVAKRELFDLPFVGQVLSRTHFISVDRSSRNSGALAASQIKRIVELGIHVWVAPEGTRSEDGQLLAFKKGSFRVAIDAQIPVQPILILNSFQTCPKGSLLPRPGSQIFVNILPAIAVSNFKDRAKLCEFTYQVMKEELLRAQAALGSEFSIQRGQTQA